MTMIRGENFKGNSLQCVTLLFVRKGGILTVKGTGFRKLRWILKYSNSNKIPLLFPTDDVVQESPIQQFYRNKCIFLTGGTGFFGKGEWFFFMAIFIQIKAFFRILHVVLGGFGLRNQNKSMCESQAIWNRISVSIYRPIILHLLVFIRLK